MKYCKHASRKSPFTYICGDCWLIEQGKAAKSSIDAILNKSKPIIVDIYEKDTPEFVSNKVKASIDEKVIFGKSHKFKKEVK
jgi:hypothetical protein